MNIPRIPKFQPFANLSAFCRDSGSTDNFSGSLATVSKYLKLIWPFLQFQRNLNSMLPNLVVYTLAARQPQYKV